MLLRRPEQLKRGGDNRRPRAAACRRIDIDRLRAKRGLKPAPRHQYGAHDNRQQSSRP
jgi:hypothetical protein